MKIRLFPMVRSGCGRNFKLRCLGFASHDHSIARLWSRVLHLHDGHANASFFHQHFGYCKKNFTAKLKVGDQVVTNQGDKHEAVLNYYENLLGSSQVQDFSLDLSVFHFQQHDLFSLEEPFSEDEVWAHWSFYKSCWEIIRVDLLLALSAVHHGHVSKFRLLNTALIFPLPKEVDAIQVKDFRPISLIHSFAKLVAKLMANRLAPLLPDLVPVNQSAFVKGRSIHDNFLLVQQIAKCLHQRKERHILLKLDVSKAFDSVSWIFLILVMKHLGFGQRWCNITCLLLSTSSSQFLVNGGPGEHIFHRRGLHQGDPLSHMLFILLMDVLNSYELGCSCGFAATSCCAASSPPDLFLC